MSKWSTWFFGSKTTKEEETEEKELEQQGLLAPTSNNGSANGNGNSKNGDAGYASVYDATTTTSTATTATQQQAEENKATTDDTTSKDDEPLSMLHLICILSTAFCYGCIFSTLFLITLPIECQRIHEQHPTIPKSVSLGCFVAIAGVTQLISPLVGRLSDIFVPPTILPMNSNGNGNNGNGNMSYSSFRLSIQQLQEPQIAPIGQRLPYLVLGSLCTVIGLFGQMLASYAEFWVRYSAFFFLHMVGLNIMYAMMLALLPDQVPPSQTGLANGILALELVLGSLFGFGLFHLFVIQTASADSDMIQAMYGLYICTCIAAAIATGTHAHGKDAALAQERMELKKQREEEADIQEQARQEQGLAQVVEEDTTTDRRDYLKAQHQHRHSSSTKQQQHDGQNHRHPPLKRWRRAARRAVFKARQVLFLTPTLVLKAMLVDPFYQTLDWSDVLESYTIDTEQYHNFFIVTISRLFYYSGMSIQTFFLYYVHDVLHVTDNAEAVVATLAILGQASAAITCYPVGVLSDSPWMNGQRRPFVYLACAILFGASLSLVFIHNIQQMTKVILTLGAANGMYLTMDTSLAVDMLPPGVEDSAQLLGVWGVAAFLGSALGPMIGGPLLYIFGHGGSVADAATATTTDDDATDMESYDWLGYAVVLSLGSCYFLASAVTLLFIRPEPKAG